MKEYFPDIINKYMPEIEPYIENEKVVMRFVGTWIGGGARLSGLYVVTDKKIYFRGKVKMSAWSTTASLAISGSKSKHVHMIPLDAIIKVVQKKNVFTITEKLDWMGEKYAKKGKKMKVAIEIAQGKEAGKKETKDELFARCDEFRQYIESKMSASS
ncbi:MAG: hypothetical protein ACTSRP_07845 [Candidatus Helarchaeota archaeon]